MTLNQLTYFMHVAQLASITKAANKLYVTHSTVSRSVSELEEELNVSLLTRENNKLVPTDAGMVMLEHCKRVLADVEKLKQDMMKISTANENNLRLSLPSVATDSPIFTAINKFKKEFPMVSIAFEDLDLDNIEMELINEKVDMVITYSFILESMNLPYNKFSTANLMTEEIMAVLNTDAPEAQQDSLDLTVTKMKHPLILADADMNFMSKMVPSSLFAPHRNSYHAQPISLNSIILGVLDGSGWVCLPACVAERFSGMCKVLPLKNLDTKHFLTVCWRREPKKAILEKLVTLIKEEFKDYDISF